MRRDQLILELSRRLGIPKHSAQVFLHAFFDSAKAALRTGDPLRLGSIGTWTPTIHTDGTLDSITFAPSTDVYAVENVPPAGPHSSIDTIHFIPADALDADASNPSATMIDVAALVEEVQSQFRSPNGQGNGEGPPIPLPEFPPVDAIPHDDGISLEDETLSYADIDADEDDYSTDTFLEEDTPALTEDSFSDDALSPEDASVVEDLYAEQTIIVEDAFTSQDETEVDDEYNAMEFAEETDGLIDDEVSAEPEDADDEEEDQEVFYRNRDQLYNPPEESNSRRLMMIALALTVVVVTILLFILFGKEERPAVPGHSTGYSFNHGMPTMAGAPFPYFE